ncbi:hypothetical protein NPIL_170171 [Nephila pilipes]|uniref:Uncharacterized protein n=1 Tax=Nephila pilipes TaxID=299642 RepID=A0A8X6U7B9_NEPPI|nr:hypothetical protein NPIL_170171 [Nephila pilipes]
MYSKIFAKIILCAWIWCVLRLLIFNIYDIAYMLPFIIILDQIATTSSTLTSTGSTRSNIIGYAEQEDHNEKKEKNIGTKGKEEIELNKVVANKMSVVQSSAQHGDERPKECVCMNIGSGPLVLQNNTMMNVEVATIHYIRELANERLPDFTDMLDLFISNFICSTNALTMTHHSFGWSIMSLDPYSWIYMFMA